MFSCIGFCWWHIVGICWQPSSSILDRSWGPYGAICRLLRCSCGTQPFLWLSTGQVNLHTSQPTGRNRVWFWDCWSQSDFTFVAVSCGCFLRCPYEVLSFRAPGSAWCFVLPGLWATLETRSPRVHGNWNKTNAKLQLSKKALGNCHANVEEDGNKIMRTWRLL